MPQKKFSKDQLATFGMEKKQEWFDYVLTITLMLISVLFGILLLTDTVPLIGYVVLFSLWIVKSFFLGQPTFSTPMDFTVLGLLILLPVGLVLSHNSDLSLPKIHGLILSVATFGILQNLIRNLKRLKWAILLLIAMAFIFALLGLFGADWSYSYSTLPSRILAILPLPVDSLHQLTSSGGIHINTIGGTLALFVPLLISLLFDNGAFKRAFLRKKHRARSMEIVYKVIVGIGIALVTFILIMTESRGALLGSMVGIFVFMVWKNKRFLFLIPLLLLVIFVAMLVFADGDPAMFLLKLDTYSNPSGDTLQTRIEYWKNTIYLIQDFPITGAGIGTYGKVFHDIYPFATPLATLRPLFYAHNMYLAVAADMGLPALTLYV